MTTLSKSSSSSSSSLSQQQPQQQLQQRPRIQKLPKEVVDRIAAGEVVQRPASVAKELMENSLDANCTSVDVVCCSTGGFHLLSVTDNGDGIHPADLNLTAVRFATSKLIQYDDLKSISTFGFRGEALASASMVSRLTITSKSRSLLKHKKQQPPPQQHLRSFSTSCAYKQTFRDGKPYPYKHPPPKPTPSAGNYGTVVKMEDLFYNVPSRRRAFAGSKKENEEYHRVLQVAQRYAIHCAARGVALTCKRMRKKGGAAAGAGGGGSCDLNTQSLGSVKQIGELLQQRVKKDRGKPSLKQEDDKMKEDKKKEDKNQDPREKIPQELRMEACKAAIGHVFGSAVSQQLLPLHCGTGDVHAVAVEALRILQQQQQGQGQGQEGALDQDCGILPISHNKPNSNTKTKAKSNIPALGMTNLHWDTTPSPSSTQTTQTTLQKINQFTYAHQTFGLLTNASYLPPKSSSAFVLFINDRLVECPSLKRAVEAAYADSLPKGGKPFCYFSIKLPGPHVDVNVHPTKKEVALLFEDRLCEDLAEEVRKVLATSSTSRVFEVQALLPGGKKRKSGGGGVVSMGGGSQRVKKEVEDEVRSSQDKTNNKEDHDPADTMSSQTQNETNDTKRDPPSFFSPDKTNNTANKVSPIPSTKKKKPYYDPKSMVRTNAAAPAGALEPFLMTQPPLSQPRPANPYKKTPLQHQQQRDGEEDGGTTAGTQDDHGSPNMETNDNHAKDKDKETYSFEHASDCDFAKSSNPAIDMTLPGAFTAAICRCRIERGETLPPLVPTRPPSQSQSQSQSPQPIVIRPKRIIPTECSYASIQTLRSDIAARCHSELATKMRDATYVGCLSRQRSLIQWGMELLMVNHYELSRELFYQLAVWKFGGGAASAGAASAGDGTQSPTSLMVASLGVPVDVKEVMMAALKAEAALDGGKEDSHGGNQKEEEVEVVVADGFETNRELAEQATACLAEKAEMLEEYFGIVLHWRKVNRNHNADAEVDVDVDLNGGQKGETPQEQEKRLFVVGLPVLLDGHSPSPHGLPVFLLRLATEVDWTEERPCFEGVCTELGYFYADLPFFEEEEEVASTQDPSCNTKSQDQAADGSRRRRLVDHGTAKFVQHTLFPALSFLLVPPRDFAEDGTVTKLAALSSLYKVFERC